MKAIKRLIPLLLIGLLAVGAMSGCTRRKPENTTTPTPTPTVAPASRGQPRGRGDPRTHGR